MRKTILAGRSTSVSFAFFAFVLLFPAAGAWAASGDAQLKRDIAAIDNDAAGPHQSQIVAERLAKEFAVPVDDVAALRRSLPGMGEVAAVYAFADKLPGGITADNVNKVVSERQSRKDWAEIATALGVRLKSVSIEVHVVYKGVHKDIAQAGKTAKGAGAGGEGNDTGS